MRPESLRISKQKSAIAAVQLAAPFFAFALPCFSHAGKLTFGGEFSFSAPSIIVFDAKDPNDPEGERIVEHAANKLASAPA